MSTNLIGLLKMALTAIILGVSMALFKLSKDYIDDNKDDEDKGEE